MKAHRRVLFVLAVGLLALACALPASAGIIIDPKPPFLWKDMLASELVVVAKYHSHDKKKLRLEVVRVVRGKDVKTGQVIEVALEHWYSVETGPVGFDAMMKELRKEAKEDTSAKLCYKQQIMNPGPAVPVRILADVRQPAMYFFPKGPAPALVQSGQVHMPDLADGWEATLAGKPMPLGFRLLQHVNAKLAREALEELAETRDPATLHVLFTRLGKWPTYDWRHREPSVEGILSRIGDKNGDVYDWALTALRDQKNPPRTDTAHAMMRLMAQGDPERALREFRRMIEDENAPWRWMAAGLVGQLRDEKAVELALDTIRIPELRDQGISAVCTLLQDRDWPAARSGWLLESALPRLLALLASAELTEKQKTALGSCLEPPLEEPRPVIDLDKARKVLLNPEEKCYHGWADSVGATLYRDMTHATDARWVPLLVQVARAVPASRDSKAYYFAMAMRHYVAITPNAVHAELVRQDLAKVQEKEDGFLGGLQRDLAMQRGLPFRVEHLPTLVGLRGSDRWLREKAAAPAVVAALQLRVAESVRDKLLIDELRALLELDRGEGLALLRRAVVNSERYPGDIRGHVAALAIKFGVADRRDELFAAETDPACLLLADDEKALQRYLEILDRMPRAYTTKWDWEYPDSHYLHRLQALFPRHAGLYFDRVLALLESKSLLDRTVGVDALRGTLHWDADFDPNDVAAVRSVHLARVKPFLKRLSGQSEFAMRVRILKELGVNLPGQPSPGWLPALRQAALGTDSAVVLNALMLIEDITGHYGCLSLSATQPAQRRWSLDAFLRDRDARPTPKEPARLSLPALWADLARADTAQAYGAAAILIAAPEQTLPFFREQLRPVRASSAGDIARLVAELDSDRFAVREAAMNSLEQRGDAAGPLLCKLAADPKASAEARNRAAQLLDRLQRLAPSPEDFRTWRALEVLERIGTDEARELVEALARGAAEALLTREARATLRRWPRSGLATP